jgi:hypothetical protein
VCHLPASAGQDITAGQIFDHEAQKDMAMVGGNIGGCVSGRTLGGVGTFVAGSAFSNPRVSRVFMFSPSAAEGAEMPRILCLSTFHDTQYAQRRSQACQ